MLTYKKIFLQNSERASEFNPLTLKWIAKNQKELKAKFNKAFPKSSNIFNIQLRNSKGTKRQFIYRSTGDAIIDTKNAYKAVISWEALRKMGCPVSN